MEGGREEGSRGSVAHGQTTWTEQRAVDRTTRRDPSHWELPPAVRRTQQDNDSEQPSSGPPVNQAAGPVNQAAARGRGRGSGRPPGRPRGSRNRGRGGQSQVRS